MTWSLLFTNLTRSSFSYLMNKELIDLRYTCKTWEKDATFILRKRIKESKTIKDLFATNPTSIPIGLNFHTLYPLPGGDVGVANNISIVCLSAEGREVENHPFNPRTHSSLCEFEDVRYFATLKKLIAYNKTTKETSSVGDLDSFGLVRNNKFVFDACYALSKDRLIFQCKMDFVKKKNNVVVSKTECLGIIDVDVSKKNYRCNLFPYDYFKKIGDFFYFFDNKKYKCRVTKTDSNFTMIRQTSLSEQPKIDKDTPVVNDLAIVINEDIVKAISVYSPDGEGNLRLLWKKITIVEAEVGVHYPYLLNVIKNNIYIHNIRTGQLIFESKFDSENEILFEDNILTFTRISTEAYHITPYGAIALPFYISTSYKIIEMLLHNDKLFILRSDLIQDRTVVDIRSALRKENKANRCIIL